MQKTFMLISAALLFAACASTSPPLAEQAPRDPAGALATLMDGAYRTAITDTQNTVIDRRYAISPLGPGSWLYMQVNSGPQEKVYRQRIVQLQTVAPGVVRQQTYSLKDPQAYANVPNDENRLNEITKNDLTDAFDNSDCQMIWRQSDDGWTGIVNPDICTIFSQRRQKTIRIGAESILTASNLYQAERGFEESGAFLWGSAPDTFLTLERLQ